MMLKKMNKADKTLFTAAVLFLFFLCLHIEYPGNTFAEGLLFCAEAALVGGIADWFAVTAIFEKPLGFPWHTAILPRRRASFIEATGRVLQQEFFSRKKMIGKVQKIDFSQYLVEWLRKDSTRQFIVDGIVGFISKMRQGHTKDIAVAAKREFDQQPVVDILRRIAQDLPNSDMSYSALRVAAVSLGAKAATEDFRLKIQDVLEKYQESKMNGSMAMMMAGFAQSMNLVNIPEAAMLAQEQTIKFLSRLEEERSVEQSTIVNIVTNTLLEIADSEDMQDDLTKLWQGLLSKSTVEKNVKEFMERAFSIFDNGMTSEHGQQFRAVLEKMVSEWTDDVLENEDMHKAVNGLFYDMAARSVLQAQEMLGDITREVLSTLTDEQINHLIYDKVEPDLLWIRMNGSIVGASIGAVLFTISKICGF